MGDGQIQRNLIDSVCKIKSEVLTDDFSFSSILQVYSLLFLSKVSEWKVYMFFLESLL